MSPGGTGVAQLIRLAALWPDLRADSALSSLIPVNVQPTLRLVLSLLFVNVQLIIMEG